MSRIILNSIQCNNCKSVLVSYTRHDFNQCSCGSVCVDGGKDYLRRVGINYTELSVTTDDPFEVIRKHFFWASNGKDGKEPLKRISLDKITDSHLDNLIEYHKTTNFRFHLYQALHRYEKHYRMINNITVEE